MKTDKPSPTYLKNYRPPAYLIDKVHLDVGFTRFRADGTAIASYRSLWVIAKLSGRWGAQLRSSFAA